ncbi:MAG: hypothetical protein WCP41_04395 [Verrucomicrobiota bacterium]|jgi:hypothetical protein
MKQLLCFPLLLALLLLAGCADNEPTPKKKHYPMVGTPTNDSQFTTNNATGTNGTNSLLTDTNGNLIMADTNAAANNTAASPANPFPTPTPVPVAPPRDLPYGTPVPGKPGFVTSPHSPTAGYVDVRGFPPGSEVKDPYSGKIFLVP